MDNISLMDLMPTLLDLSIGEKMENVQGISFKNTIFNNKNLSDRDLFFYEKMARPKLTGDFPAESIVDGNFKLIHFLQDDRYELYDLSVDLSEKNNLIDLKPEIFNKLKLKIINYHSKLIK